MQVILKNVRLSYPSLFKATSFTGQDGKTSDPKYSATLIMDREDNAADIKKLEKAIDAMVKEHFKGNRKALKGVCLRDGEEKTDDDGEYKDGYGEEVMFTTASNKSRPTVVNGKKEPLTEEDGVIYAGCYVNAVISLWAQSNGFGKRINANLKAVQFVRAGDPFGEASVNVDEVFDEIEDDEDADSMMD